MRPVMAPVAVHRARTTPITIMSTPPPWFSSERLRLSWRSEIVSRRDDTLEAVHDRGNRVPPGHYGEEAERDEEGRRDREEGVVRERGGNVCDPVLERLLAGADDDRLPVSLREVGRAGVDQLGLVPLGLGRGGIRLRARDSLSAAARSSSAPFRELSESESDQLRTWGPRAGLRRRSNLMPRPLPRGGRSHAPTAIYPGRTRAWRNWKTRRV